MDSFLGSISEPLELLRDPSAWLPVDDLESFFDAMGGELRLGDVEGFFRKVGQENSSLKAWGVLDSVLRMLESPRDIFAQPDRLLSYFLSPHPNVQVKVLGQKEVTFSFDFNVKAYPLVTSYLMGAMEGLPQYMDYPMAQLNFSNNEFHLNWDDGQEPLFDENEIRKKNFKPEMVQSVLQSLQDQRLRTASAQKDRAYVSPGGSFGSSEELTKQGLVAPSFGDGPVGSHSLSSPQSSGPTGASFPANSFGGDIASASSEELTGHIEEKIEERLGDLFRRQDETRHHLGQIKNDFFKLYDYFTRAQQLITLISSSARKASVREAMRRVDWALVQQQFPKIIEGTCDSLGSIEESVVIPVDMGLSTKGTRKKSKWSLNEAIEEVIETLEYVPGRIRIEKRWWADSEVSVDISKVQEALKSVFNLSISRCQSGCELRVVTRPSGRKVEVEITHTGQNLKIDEMSQLLESNGLLAHTRSLLESQKCRFDIQAGGSEGSTFVIQLPITTAH